MIGFQMGKIMLYTPLVILILLSPSYSDKGVDKITPSVKSSLLPKSEESENIKTDGAHGGVGDSDVDGNVGDGEVDGNGKVILLYHPVNTKSHRNQQNAIAEVSL